MVNVIEISSDSETEASPDKVRRTALNGFLPRKEKEIANGARRSDGLPSLSQTHGVPARPSSAHARPASAQARAAEGQHMRRKASDSPQYERRPVDAHPARRPAPPQSVPRHPSAESRDSLIVKLRVPLSRQSGNVQPHGPQVNGPPPPADVQAHAARTHAAREYHTKEAMRTATLPSYKWESTSVSSVRHDTEANTGRSAILPGNSSQSTSSITQTASQPNIVGPGATRSHRPAPPVNVTTNLKRPASPFRAADPEPEPKRQRLSEVLAAQAPKKFAGSLHLLAGDTPSPQLSQMLPQAHFANSPLPGLARNREEQTTHTSKMLPLLSSPKAQNISQQKDALGPGAKVRFTPADNALLIELKEQERLSWDEITPRFPGRSKGTLQVHYSTKVKKRLVPIGDQASERSIPKPVSSSKVTAKPAMTQNDAHRPQRASETRPSYQAPTRRARRGAGPSAVEGFVSWTQVTETTFEDSIADTSEKEAEGVEQDVGSLAHQDRVIPSTFARLLRQRELGIAGGRAWQSSGKSAMGPIKEHIVTDHLMTRSFMNTCGDVTCLAWDSSGKYFAASSIAISDDRSMQYNSNLNLLAGDAEKGILQELPEHHIPRPVIGPESGNVNSLHAMRESQDPRLFMTVASVAFSPNGKRLYSGGGDRKVRVYRMDQDVSNVRCRYEIEHPAPVDILSVGRHGLLASACHVTTDGNVRVFDCQKKTFDLRHSFSPGRADAGSSLPLFPSALRWGAAAQHSSLLLAGFSSDTVNEARSIAGETALWNAETGQRLPLSAVTRNVFDLAWNPSPSPASTAFAVASVPPYGKSYKGKQSVVHLYAPEQDRAKHVLELECPAFDINDLVYCPHDDNLIAAGATDGKVYIWDKRFTGRNQLPLHSLAHGESVNVLDHDRDRELADTGIRFLSWGAASSRLYSGSSDGVVKVWNPYRATNSAHVQDAASFQTAVMSGAFSPDFRDLLVGEECGRLNHLRIEAGGDDEGTGRAPRRFKLQNDAQAGSQEASCLTAQELVRTKQIAIRNMGDLPKKQAVQGPDYAGPYLKPSNRQWQEAEAELRRAQDSQNEAYSQLGMASSQSSETNATVRDADTRVRTAQADIDTLQRRYDAADVLEPQAVENQRALCRKERLRSQLEASYPPECCKLDCNYLPRHEDSKAGAADNFRSEQRIPSALKSLPRTQVDVADMNCHDLNRAGLASECPHCPKMVTNPRLKAHYNNLCKQRCASIRAGFSSVCNRCSAPVRGVEQNQHCLCERCAFSCFRCSRAALLLPAVSGHAERVHCEHCNLTWTLGALGYDLVQSESPQRKPWSRLQNKLEDEADLGQDEITHYHSRWDT